MKAGKSAFLLLFAGLIVSLVLFAQPANVAGQDKNAPENNKKKSEPDDDDDDEVTAEEGRQARISMDAAKAIALQKVPGKVIDAELEKERGRLQYAIDVRTADGKMFDVEIDAITGEILQSVEEDDDDNDDRQSAKREFRKNAAKPTTKLTVKKPI